MAEKIHWVSRVQDEDRPKEAGWYATHICWDQSEGTFMSANYWDGKQWDDCTERILNFSSRPFTNELEADQWANAQDISH